jgi:hypothetical protein
MNLTKNDITTVRTRLRQEITERECLLAAVELFEKYATSGLAPDSINLGGLLSTLVPGQPTIEIKELKECTPAPAPAALPPVPPPERYVHPELKHGNFAGHGAHANLVRWAIARMTHDYSLHDILALLKREGRGLRAPEVSVVLTRMKARGEIEEIRRSAGPHPALFRKPESAASPTDASVGAVTNTDPTATSAAVS